MTTTDERPAPRWELPVELVERGRDSVLRLTLDRDGSVVIPSAAALAVTDSTGAVITTGTPAATGEGYEATIAGAVTSPLTLGDGYRAVWTVTVDGTEYTYDTPIVLCRRVLFPSLSDFHIRRRLRSLDANVGGAIVRRTSFQAEIDDAWWTIQRRLLEMGRRPWLILGPSSLHDAHMALALHYVFRDLGLRGNPSMRETADDFQRDYERELGRVSFRYDEDEDGRDDDPTSTTAATSAIFLGGAPPRYRFSR